MIGTECAAASGFEAHEALGADTVGEGAGGRVHPLEVDGKDGDVTGVSGEATGSAGRAVGRRWG